MEEGLCYVLAFNALAGGEVEALIRSYEDGLGWQLAGEPMLVHGVLTVTERAVNKLKISPDLLGKRVSHAWVELTLQDEVRVWDFGSIGGKVSEYSRAEYYEIADISPESVARYSLIEAMTQNAAFGHYGPWK